MANINNEIRKQFINSAIAKYGSGAIISKTEIDRVAIENGLAIPQWFFRDDRFKIGRNQYQLPQIGHTIGEVGHQMQYNTNVAHNGSIAPESPEIAPQTVVKSDDELLVEINDSFTTLNVMAQSIKNGVTTSLIVAGPAGVGKSHTVESVMGDNEFNTFYVHGKIKATALYKLMYQYKEKGQTIIIDDSDELFFEEVSLNLLKNALDSKEKRHVSWLSEYVLEIDGEEVPKTFCYQGSMVFITNLDFYQEINKGSKIGKHLSAILSRSHYIDIELNTKRKLFLHTCNVLYNGMLQRLELTEFQENEMIDYIETNLDKLREITPRMAVKLSQLIKIGYNWKTLANTTLLKK